MFQDLKQHQQETAVIAVQFSTRLPHSKKGCVEIMYAERFQTGKFFVGAVIPIEKFRMSFVMDLIKDEPFGQYDPAIINRDVGPCLRLIWEFPEVTSGATGSMQRRAREKAMWAEAKFGMKSYVMPIKGYYEALRRLCAVFH